MYGLYQENIIMINKKMELNKETALRLWTKQFGKCGKTKDFTGREIAKAAYNDRKSKFGWNVDHILPQSRGGKTNDSNLVCCHILTNDEKADKFPCFVANERTFEIQKKQNHYEIVSKNEKKEENFFDHSFGIDFFNECISSERVSFSIGFVKIKIVLGETADKDIVKALVSFVEEIFDSVVDLKKNSGGDIILTYVDCSGYNQTRKGIQELVDNCILINTYAQHYFVPHKICEEIQIFCDEKRLRNESDLSREINNIYNENVEFFSNLVITGFVKDNIDAKEKISESDKRVNKLGEALYVYNYEYTKLAEDLEKNY